jgi:general stress protein 26
VSTVAGLVAPLGDADMLKANDADVARSSLFQAAGAQPMSDYTLEDLSQKMREIDFAMLFTRSEGGELAGRPMSNNGEVDYEGDSYFFTYDSSRTAQDIAKDSKVGLSYQGSGSLLGKPPIFIAIEGDASLIATRMRLPTVGQRFWTGGSNKASKLPDW